MIASSKWPSTGIKSGIRSNGMQRYAIAKPKKTLAARGVRASLRTRRYTANSRLKARARSLLRCHIAEYSLHHLTRHKISYRARERAGLQPAGYSYARLTHQNGARLAASPG